MMRDNLKFEQELWKTKPLIAGVDEAGRGALAGPIVVAGVILPTRFKDNRIQDSKTLSPGRRSLLYSEIKRNAIDIKVSIVDVSAIEKDNPTEATKTGMKKVMNSFKVIPNLCLIDGEEKIDSFKKFPILSLVKGDSKSINVAAASIIAKVTRDNIMQQLHVSFPVYNWYKNKGYADKEHLLALFEHSYCGIHRENYEPIKSLVKKERSIEEIKARYSKVING